MRIAIIGGGVSGLVCAHMLHSEHELVVFEASDQAGGHANTVRVETEAGVYDVDTGFIVFNDRNYPNFERLLDELGVPTQALRDELRGERRRRLRVQRGLAERPVREPRPDGQALLSPDDRRPRPLQPRRPRAARLRRGSRRCASGWPQRRYSRAFVRAADRARRRRRCGPRIRRRCGRFPARFLVEFFDNHGMLGFRDRPRWRTITGGSRSYVEALTRPWRDRLRLSTPVTEVARHPDHVTVSCRATVSRSASTRW